MKEIRWLGTSLSDLRAFPEAARREAGYQLHRVQHGLPPTDYKPMPGVGASVYEIRIRTVHQAHRVFYVAKTNEALYVLHAFEKKTQKTARRDIELGRRRYHEIPDLR